MQINLELPDEYVRETITSVARTVLGESWDRRLTGVAGQYLRDEIERQVKAHIDTVDLSAEITEAVELQMMPTIRDAIERELKAAARKAVKTEMEKRYVPESA
jgi:hypothetical protein